MALALKQKRRLLRLAIVTTVAAGSWLASTIGAGPASRVDRSDQATAAGDSADATEPPRARLDADDPLWTKPLRRPLYDPPPPPPPKVVKKVLPPLRAKLMGTIIEPGASKAMIELPGGRVEFRAEGEELGPPDQDAVVSRIGPESITVARGDEETELKIERRF